MKVKIPVSALLIVALLATLVASPAVEAGKDKKAKQIRFSGFLENYDDLRRADDISKFVWGYTKQPLVLRDYDKALIDPVLVYFHEDAKGVAMDPLRLADLTTYFRERVVREVSAVREVEVVDEPGPGVMRVRIAITDIRLARAGANIGTKVVGTATAGVGFLIPGIVVGGATMECEVLDSVSGERLMAVVDTDSGRRMFNVKSMSKMGDVKAAIREWAKDFRKNLQRIHEGRLPKKLERRQDGGS